MPYNAGDLKWGQTTLGTPSGTITWSADYVDALNYSTAFTSSDVDAALTAAFDTWESVAAIDFQMVSSGTPADVTVASAGLNGAAGTAQYTFGSNPGLSEIFSGTVTFNSNYSWSPYGGSGGVDFFAVALHEIGHIIGLGHVNDPSEIMNPIISTDTLGSGDIAGAQFLYGRDSGDVPTPAGEGPATAAAPSAGVSSSDDGGGGGAGLLLGLLAAIVGLLFGGVGAGVAIAAGRVAMDEDQDGPDTDDDHGHESGAGGIMEHVHSVYVAGMPLPGIPVEDCASCCGCYGPCDCAIEQAYGNEALI